MIFHFSTPSSLIPIFTEAGLKFKASSPRGEGPLAPNERHPCPHESGEFGDPEKFCNLIPGPRTLRKSSPPLTPKISFSKFREDAIGLAEKVTHWAGGGSSFKLRFIGNI
ncbi:MAG: hypothetical protein H0X26_02185 [Alphaproteobacteria bacterium]|nr:hypothetical protein [Alphaproteobacteria bacterium]